ncbi:hypothetical protein H9L39_07804 [Fusarium oxysporum f. sp. albedinis]|nr:hypothetical protein H9L39_07804 [Fusarium oxysporum f. sp. albedinis]
MKLITILLCWMTLVHVARPLALPRSEHSGSSLSIISTSTSTSTSTSFGRDGNSNGNGDTDRENESDGEASNIVARDDGSVSREESSVSRVLGVVSPQTVEHEAGGSNGHWIGDVQPGVTFDQPDSTSTLKWNESGKWAAIGIILAVIMPLISWSTKKTWKAYRRRANVSPIVIRSTAPDNPIQSWVTSVSLSTDNAIRPDDEELQSFSESARVPQIPPLAHLPGPLAFPMEYLSRISTMDRSPSDQ